MTKNSKDKKKKSDHSATPTEPPTAPQSGRFSPKTQPPEQILAQRYEKTKTRVSTPPTESRSHIKPELPIVIKTKEVANSSLVTQEDLESLLALDVSDDPEDDIPFKTATTNQPSDSEVLFINSDVSEDDASPERITSPKARPLPKPTGRLKRIVSPDAEDVQPTPTMTPAAAGPSTKRPPNDDRSEGQSSSKKLKIETSRLSKKQKRKLNKSARKKN